MDYKEKLEKAMELYPTANADQRYVLECLFPELAENRDERIKKALICLVQEFYEQTSAFYKEESVKDMLAWLEKQGETFTKKDVDDAYLKGVCDAKQELEKQELRKFPTPADVGFEELGKVWAEEANKQKLANSAKTCKKSQRMISAEAKDALYGKPAWSEEDEHRINRISDFIWKNRKGDTDEIYQQEQDANWLKSLKERIGG